MDDFFGGMRMRYYLAIDIGASSGRHILGHVEDGKMVLEEIHRFDNKQIRKGGHDTWDMDNLRCGIIEGMKACKTLGKIPETVGIDTWAVDYVLLDENDNIIGDAVAYRDRRTEGMREEVSKLIPPEELYSRCGIQYQSFNTVYQLTALKREDSAALSRAKRLFMIPEYFNFMLCGIKQNEYTNATSTNLVNARSKDWDFEVIEKLGLPRDIFGPLATPGTILAPLTPEIEAEVGYSTTVMLPATHDTGSAFLAVPARDENAVYISSGTWSLLGVENSEPITSPESYAENFTNEGGAWYRFRYLKNIMGLWMIQSVRRELNGVSYIAGKEIRKEAEKKYSFDDLVNLAKEASDFPSRIDVNKDVFLSPDSMIEAIKGECLATKQRVPDSVGELMQCIYMSLADCYKRAIDGLSKLTGKRYTSINIVGGGCKDDYLSELTARATGLPVFAGPTEGTAIGNLIVQMIRAGEYADLQAARDSVRISFDIKEI